MPRSDPATGRRRLIAAAVGATVLVVLAAVVAHFDEAARNALWRAHEAVNAWVTANRALGIALFVLAMTIAKMSPVPLAAAMMVVGGYMFGTALGGLLAAFSAALSAAIVFTVGRPIFAAMVRHYLGPRFATVESEIARNAFNYILAIRLMPVIPAWFANLLPLAFPIPFHTMIAATSIGILPASFVFSSVGAGIATVAALPEATTTEALMRPELILPLAGLSLLSLMPMLVRRLILGTRNRDRSSRRRG
ncbi:MAG: TVP38/TMEM64 family protein [Rhodospirillales bacterium]|nr:MAG: TVP38/TMEM64 family protein [Rhodospirillales bacterium]